MKIEKQELITQIVEQLFLLHGKVAQLFLARAIISCYMYLDGKTDVVPVIQMLHMLKETNEIDVDMFIVKCTYLIGEHESGPPPPSREQSLDESLSPNVYQK